MAVYLYNLGFSASNKAKGNFTSGGSGVNMSNAWFLYNAQGLPPGANSNQNWVTSVLPASNWTQQNQVPSLLNAGADYVLLRIFNSDNNPGNYKLRVNVIFGQGDSAAIVANGNLQSPFQSPNGNALPNIAFDGSVPPLPNSPSWPAPFTDVAGGVNSASSWTYSIGQVHNPAASTVYIFNVGATVFDVSGAGPAYYSYGIDPRMKVGGVGVPVAKDAA